jgi:cytochrome c oxidase subunit 2
MLDGARCEACVRRAGGRTKAPVAVAVLKRNKRSQRSGGPGLEGGTMQRWMMSAALGLVAAAASVPAALAEMTGIARPWQMGMQPPASPVAEQIQNMNHLLNGIITVIVVLVLSVLGYIIVRFSARRNPTPSKTAHNTLLEVVWTVVPVLILVVIAIPSMRLLYLEDRVQNPDMTLKVVGRQWYWNYSYPDHGDFSFDSVPISYSDLQPGQPRLLAVDNPVVVPVGANVQVLTTADDVIHNWAVPALGLKRDAVPGRVTETWFRADHEGVFYGQCSELCGVNHYFMPIQVIAVSPERFDAWVKEAQAKFAKADRPGVQLASHTRAVHAPPGE